jgi:hypothetical protein
MAMYGSERSAAHYTHFTLGKGHPVTATNRGLRKSLGGTSRAGSIISVALESQVGARELDWRGSRLGPMAGFDVGATESCKSPRFLLLFVY